MFFSDDDDSLSLSGSDGEEVEDEVEAWAATGEESV